MKVTWESLEMDELSGSVGRKVLSEKTLILVMGVPSSGKTIISKRILSRVSAVYLHNNFIDDAIC